jgi:hypothetical protein
MRKRKSGARVGFSNERFLEQMASLTGISPEGEYGRLTPLVLTDLGAARGSLLVRELFSKYDDNSESPEKENTTWKKFHLAELICKETNRTFPRRFNTDRFWREVYHRIARVLKEFSWDECHRGMDFGPGATTRLPRKRSSAAYKYSGIPESTLGNAVLATCAIRMEPLWIQSVGFNPKAPNDLVKVVPGNCVIVVPKNYKTGRTIAKEPDMNIYVQKGIGSVIRRRLKSVGVNLNDQTRNQCAACEGSLLGELATIDLSMASDTLSYEVVSALLPNSWWWALEQSRSPVGVLPSGDRVVYQKFSSMGNGYTFELETLIFWAIAQCVCSAPTEMDNRILVYGDDIVVPSDKAEAVMERLREAGFTPNPDKTFHQGPYRESCGKHYFSGYDITPFYVRKPVKALDRLFLVHNNVYRWSARTGVDSSSVLTGLKGLAPAKWREPRLPDGFGDGAFVGAVDELRLDPHPYGWESWQVDALQVSQDLLCDDLPMGQLIASLKQLTSNVTKTSFRAGIAPQQRETLQSDLREHNSGLPVKEGQYRQITLQIPRRSLAS